ncbi:MAG: DUF1549 domain-containing protein, partial [Planctomycetes bacterium]|nr:DUF1549 domain-containing protein [Planctomycetota bacterium]
MGVDMPPPNLIRKLFRLPASGVFVLLFVPMGNAGVCDAAEPKKPSAAKQQGALNFEDHVVPILQSRCFKCHGEKVKKAGLDLRRRFAIVCGGDGGRALFAGKPGQSLIINMVTSKEMPPQGEPPLTAQQIATLKRWVQQGAAIKGKVESPLKEADGEIEVTQADRRFWAFRPPQRPAVPAVKTIGPVRTPVDAFLLAKLQQKQASFNPDAPQRVLVRRVYFDVLGLPPSPG